MAKLSARGRYVVAAVIKEWKNPNEPHYATGMETYYVEQEWQITKRRLMSDGHVLVWEKWKHFKHEKPFIKNWTDLGKFPDLDPDAWLQIKLNQGWTEDKSV